MSEKEEKVWEKKIRGMLNPIQESLGKLSSDVDELKKRQTQTPPSSEGEDKMPIYKCRGSNCPFSTDDLDAYIDHKIEHKIKQEPSEEETPPAPPKPKHGTSAAEIMDCPDCWGKFERELDRRGKRIVGKEPEKKEPEGVLNL